MIVLGIETSCDDTSAAILHNGSILKSNVVSSQDDIHEKFGGIVPELAGRAHIERIHRVIGLALSQARVSLNAIDLIAATRGPGLIGSLLVGLNVAKGIGYGLGKPVLGINHLEGHLLAIFLQKKIPFPYLALIVSGGHTDLCRVDGFGNYSILGRTRDDAAGESFDKVAKMLGLGYPGGPEIEKLARFGNPSAIRFPRAYLEKGSFDFSFSGLKTAVRVFLSKRKMDEDEGISDGDVASSFQESVVEVLVSRLINTALLQKIRYCVVTGGVAVNGYLRQRALQEGKKQGIEVSFPEPRFCTDNAAMIACAGYHRYKSNAAENFMNLDGVANLPLA